MNLINIKTEENLKWRQQENSPILLSHHNQQQQGETPLTETQNSSIDTAIAIKNTFNSPKTENNNNIAKFYITLAKESPIHYDENDSDTTYDSYHARSTDVCMDSCDTESNSSDYLTDVEVVVASASTTVAVVEYEVASASASEDLYSNDSSSGTDENIFAMAKEILESRLGSGCGFWSSDFADTEESDNSDSNCIDLELSPADYWKCVKCKNQQNNPMFRYCEKCYQIRKTHFPPRPKLGKNRKTRKRKASSPIFQSNSIDNRRRKLSFSPSISDNQNESAIRKTSSNMRVNEEITIYNSGVVGAASTSNGNNNIKTNNRKKRKLSYKNVIRNNSQLNSAAETSSDDDCYSSNSCISFESTSNFHKKLFSSNKNEHNNNNSNLNFNDKSPILSNTYKSAIINSSFNNRKRKILTDGGDDIDSEICSQTKIKLNSTNITKPKSDIDLHDSEKDSGISSAPSTQDYGDELILQQHSTNFQNISDSEELLSTINSVDQKLIKNDGNDSSDTVSEELNESYIAEIEENLKLTPELDDTIFQNSKIPKSANNNDCKQDILNNLDRHISELTPITDKPNYDSLIPRSISVSDPYKTNLRRIESPPHSPTSNYNIALKNNSTNNCTTNFDDKLSSILNQSEENQIDSSYGLCIICVTEPKNGAFVHSRFVHLCCCYKCAVKIWNKNKKCPICNCAVKNVMKLFVH